MSELGFISRVLPDHYQLTTVKNGIRCLSNTGIDEDDHEHWYYIIEAVKQYFNGRFKCIAHITCYNHVDFIIHYI